MRVVSLLLPQSFKLRANCPRNVSRLVAKLDSLVGRCVLQGGRPAHVGWPRLVRVSSMATGIGSLRASKTCTSSKALRTFVTQVAFSPSHCRRGVSFVTPKQFAALASGASQFLRGFLPWGRKRKSQFTTMKLINSPSVINLSLVKGAPRKSQGMAPHWPPQS